ncbi:putative receptor-like protein kinase [Tanacetum coccineum]
MKRALLDWEKRYKNIKGVAKGLLYLHEYSCLKIIHRDMKASNVLFDGETNAKIAYFGMAMLFKQKESQADTSRIVGPWNPERTQKTKSSGMEKMEKWDTFGYDSLTLKMGSAGSLHNIIRSIHIRLLCVQENVTDRPTMGSIVLMLNSLTILLPQPSEPTFLMHNMITDPEMQIPLAIIGTSE